MSVIQIRRSALVPYTSEQMFDLVNDVEAYPKRFDWCVAAKILERSDSDVLVARMDLKFAGFSQSLTTRNTLDRPHRLSVNLVSGPLNSLTGIWDFTALGEAGCKIALAMDFDYSGRIGGMALKLGFQGLASRMVSDFCSEAKRAYGH